MTNKNKNNDEEMVVDENATVSNEDNSTEDNDAQPKNKLSETEKLQLEVAELNDKYLRLQADYQNFRRRTIKEISMARQSGTAGGITPFLHLFDIFAMAIMAAEQSDNMDAIKQGLQMINNEYIRTIDDMGVTKINSLNVPFDPEIHEAIGYEPSEEVPEGYIIKMMSCGYKLGDLLLRPARVTVSSGKAAATENSTTETVQE